MSGMNNETKHGVEMHDTTPRPTGWGAVAELVRAKLLSCEPIGGGWRRYGLTLAGRSAVASL